MRREGWVICRLLFLAVELANAGRCVSRWGRAECNGLDHFHASAGNCCSVLSCIEGSSGCWYTNERIWRTVALTYSGEMSQKVPYLY
jgi:hypothetical protein